MKGTIAALAGISIVAVALALPAISFAQVDQRLHEQRVTNFPEMRAARHKLNEAKEILESKAAKDFHGHKMAAIKHIDEAIEEINLGIQSDRKH